MLITLASIMNLIEPDMMMTTITVGTSLARAALWIQLGIMAIPPSIVSRCHQVGGLA